PSLSCEQPPSLNDTSRLDYHPGRWNASMPLNRFGEPMMDPTTSLLLASSLHPHASHGARSALLHSLHSLPHPDKAGPRHSLEDAGSQGHMDPRYSTSSYDLESTEGGSLPPTPLAMHDVRHVVVETPLAGIMLHLGSLLRQATEQQEVIYSLLHFLSPGYGDT
ncbi:unnamed protein product, partial [Closterium sp. NIES-53]